ncbi:hypothetical protein PYCC9005_003526 [Savitreella phatthalungensis]
MTLLRALVRHCTYQSRGLATARSYLPCNDKDLSESQRDVREAVSRICRTFDDDYWLRCDRDHRFPHELHARLAEDGWLGICSPEEYGGSAMGLSEAAVMMQTISESGAGMTGASSVHMNIFGLEPVVKFGTDEQKRRWLTPLIAGKERACFAVTEPTAGLDTLRLTTRAEKDTNGDFIVNGSKVWISTAQVADKMLLLARTTPLDQVTKASQGLSLFYTDLDRDRIQVQEIPKMGRHAVDTNSVFFEDVRIPRGDLIGSEGDGFKMIMLGMNAERILIACEAVGLGFAALRKASNYAAERVVFGRTIGKNQSISHPLADIWVRLEAARLLCMSAAKLYDQGLVTGEYSNACKYLAGETCFSACERAIMTHGGMGYAQHYHVERYLRESWIPRIAPVSPQMCLNYISERVLGLERSY